MRGTNQQFPNIIFPATFPFMCDILFFWIASPYFWRTNITPFCRVDTWFYSVICFYHCSENGLVAGGWRLWTAFSNILLVLAVIFLKFSPACLNTLGLLCLTTLVSLRLDVSHTSDPLQFSVIFFPVSFFGEDRSNSYRMLSCMWPIFSWEKAARCTAAIP